MTIGKDLRIYEMDKFIDMERQKTIDEYMKLYKKEEIRSNILGTIINLIHILDEVALYSFMIYEVINNNMSIADFTFIIASIRTLSRSLTVIINNFSNNLSYSLQVNDYRKFETLDLSFNGDTKPLVADEVEIEFKNVSYSYYMQEGYTLKNISFKIKKGERIALVGHNGAGKTTLIKLICGFYHPTEGEILINGVNINEIDRESLIKLIAPVFQDSNHYAVSIKENIAMETIGNIDDEKLYMSLNLAGLTKKIESLKNGVDTIITRDMDDTGVELSGGESQKLSIARSIYKNAPFIILDEPTSALDPIAESELYMNLNKIINNHSAIFISHRLSTAVLADRIYLFEQGRIVEHGSHETLMQRKGKYADMFRKQAENYVGGMDYEE